MISKDNRTSKRKLGDLGEQIACKFLKKRGYMIVERNYLRKWGELDIVTRKSGVTHFVEVKSIQVNGLKPNVSHVTPRQNVSHVTEEGYRPEENAHPYKLKRLSRAMQTYVMEKKIQGEWQLDVITVKIDFSSRQARVELFENVII